MPRLPNLLTLALLTTLAPAAIAQMGMAPSPGPFDDKAEMMKKLGIRTLRWGADPNNQTTFDEANANPYASSMPDVLRFANGRRVTTPAEWSERRKELLELFAREVYGRVPRRVPKITWEVVGVVPGMAGSIPTLTRTLIGHVDNRRYPKVTVDIRASYTVPAHATQRVPMMLEFGFGFPGRVAQSGTPWTQQAIEHGWGYGTIIPTSIQPDSDRVDLGIIGLCNQGKPRKPDDWGALRAWAWGASQLVTYFEREKSSMVDPTKVGIEGVSRYGKAALVAQAFDPRIAVGFIASSGEGGSKLHRHIFGEAVENLAGGAAFWMAGNLMKYAASDPLRTAADLPVDSHELIALCAPRPCFISHGVVEKGDAKWVDAHGSFMAGVLAGPVYRLLGKRDFGTPGNYLTDRMPPVNILIGGDLAWRQHDGGHEATPNWPAFFGWVSRYITAPPLPTNPAWLRIPADTPSPRTDANSLTAHDQLVQKARSGRIDVYFQGDSIARRWGTSDPMYADFLANWRQNFFGWNAGDFGWGADSTQNILWRLKNGELDGVNPKVIVVLAGTNNVGGGASGEEVAGGVTAIVRECQRRAPKATILLTGIFPRFDKVEYRAVIEDANRRLSRLSDGKRIRFIDLTAKLVDTSFFVDGLHPNLKGYQVWADALTPILTELLGPRAATDLAPPPSGDPSLQSGRRG